MKAGRLIEVLKKVSPDAEVRCGIGNVSTLMVTNLFNLNRIPKYEVKSVLRIPDDDYNLPDSIAEEIIDYSLKLIEEEMK